ncbi:hypothetical protein HK405_009970, partial [Cladochytrium tenue]
MFPQPPTPPHEQQQQQQQMQVQVQALPHPPPQPPHQQQQLHLDVSSALSSLSAQLLDASRFPPHIQPAPPPPPPASLLQGFDTSTQQLHLAHPGFPYVAPAAAAAATDPFFLAGHQAGPTTDVHLFGPGPAHPQPSVFGLPTLTGGSPAALSSADPGSVVTADLIDSMLDLHFAVQQEQHQQHQQQQQSWPALQLPQPPPMLPAAPAPAAVPASTGVSFVSQPMDVTMVPPPSAPIAIPRTATAARLPASNALPAFTRTVP